MKQKSSIIALALIASLTACSNNTTADISNTVAKADVAQTSEANKLNNIVEDYFTESLTFNPIIATYTGRNEYNDKFLAPISAESIANSLAFESNYLAKILTVDSKQLNGQDLLSYEIFKRDRELDIQSFEFDDHLIPLNQMHGIHNSFAQLGSGESAQPFKTMQDYQNFIKRSHGYTVYMESVITSMRQGIEQGVVLPKAIIAKVLPQFSVHIVTDAKDSVFYGPVQMLAHNTDISAADKAKITEQYTDLILNTLSPSYQQFYNFIKDEYSPHGRDSVGLTQLRNGAAWYDYKIAVNTTLKLSAKEIHEFGQQEVARIRSEMTKVKQQVNFTGSLTEFFDFLQNDEQFYWQSESDVIKAYTDVKNDINSRLPALFEVFPKADYEVKAVEAFRAASSAGASYQSPAPDGSRPGIFYINTHNLKAQPKFILETLSIHEASPGHHFQISIQQEVQGLPTFRKFGGYTAYSEGWALYAESLGKEMGMFSDPYQWYGRLADEQLRAMRLVVDTGMHAFGWTRERAIDFMAANSSMAMSDIEAEVERYIGIPGQALSYKTGQRAIRQMRNNAEQQLGDKFDIRKFHTQILIDGALPMEILANKIQAWVDTQKS
ncbi:DUF885 family protein [Colwelliaceae bacterium BS250]